MVFSARVFPSFPSAARCFVAAAALALLFMLSAGAEPSPGLIRSPGYADAVSALESSLYDIAAKRLEALLNSPDAINFTTPDKKWLTEQMAMAHVRAKRPLAALDALDRLPDSPGATFWQAQALVQQGRFDAAERLFKTLLNGEHPHKDAIHFTRARVLGELNRLPEAVEELSEAIQSEDETTAARARVALAESLFKLGRYDEIDQISDSSIAQPYRSHLRYVIGLSLLQEPNYQKAIRAFKDVLTLRERLPSELVISCEIGLATAMAGTGQTDIAAQQLVATIEHSPDSPLLLDAFAALESLQLLAVPSIQAGLQKWNKDGATERSIIARFYSIVTEESREEQNDALPRYEAFTVEYPNHPLIPQALLRQAILLAKSTRQDGQSEALRILGELKHYSIPPPARDSIRFLTAKAEFLIANAADPSGSSSNKSAANESFRKAEAAFMETVKVADPKLAEAAAYDAAISAMRINARKNIVPYLSSLEDNPGIKGDLLIERGLYLAANQHFRDAQQALEAFIEFSPNHPRAFAAHLAMAEIAMLPVEPKFRTALRHLEIAQRQPDLTEQQMQQLDYTKFWLELSQRSDEPDAMVSQGNRFLEKWPESRWRDDVQMKMGEHYFRTENYPLALTMFENLEKESPDSELAEPALYFAGKANMRLDPTEGAERAIELWNRVVRNGGPLRISARYQQALAKRRQLKYDEAAGILRSLLKDDAISSEERKAMLCSLGETLFSQSLDAPSRLQEAESVFQSVVALSEDSPSWRNQALYRLAKCHERTGNIEAAKEAYLGVFDTKTNDTPDYVWFYRAGFQLFELLKDEENWDAAIKVGTKLANSESPTRGPRAAEAEKKIEALKLGQFRQ